MEKPSGLINLYKPPDISSAKYVYRLRGLVGIRKVGHAGTLDPFADGVILGCIGRATKLTERLMALPKEYQTMLRLGVQNATFDPEQPFELVPNARRPSLQEVKSSIAHFVGEIDQVPPIYSAVKIGGVPSYRLARAGISIEKPPRRVRIDHIRVSDYQWPQLSLEIRCGRGTYIRAIARDLGLLLECGACCESLTRTAVGPFPIQQSVDLNQADPETVRAAVLSVSEVLRRIDTPNPSP